MVIKFNPEGRVAMVFGRKKEASDEGAEPWKRASEGKPRPAIDGQFRQPTDVTWDPQGNIFISDGYINSRVAKFDKNGDWVKQWGAPGSEPGQFNTPHSIASDAKGNIYVADRGNRRIQVFDSDGTFLRQITINVPVPPVVHMWMGKPPQLRFQRGIGSAEWNHAKRIALGYLHYARTHAIHLQRRRVSGPHLQTDAGRQSGGRVRQHGPSTEAVRMDSRNGVPSGKRNLHR